MNNLINWCNSNNGFLTAILSIIGLLLSVIAIVVSIRTARLPYKKQIRLSASTNIFISKNMLTADVKSQVAGVSVNATNSGARVINLTYLGLGIIGDDGGWLYLNKLYEGMEGKGTIRPSEIHTTNYPIKDLLMSLQDMKDDTKIFIIATDSEGKIYKKKYGLSATIYNGLVNLIAGDNK